jgi:nicotinamidase-related amidase
VGVFVVEIVFADVNHRQFPEVGQIHHLVQRSVAKRTLAKEAWRDPAVPQPFRGALAKTAKIYGIPTSLTTVNEERGGTIFKQVQAVFPDQKTINRTFINGWEDRRVVEAVKKASRKKLVIAALWTEMCLAMPAIHAMGDGYDVYVVTDASGGVSPEAHDMAVRRMLAVGVQPFTWLGLAGELQRDWARTERLGEVAQLFIDHAGASGSVSLWEAQLLGAPRNGAKSSSGG